MKTCRTILIVMLCFIMLIPLAGCIVIPRYHYYDDIDTETVSSVDIYDLRNSETRYSNFLETEVPAYTLT